MPTPPPPTLPTPAHPLRADKRPPAARKHPKQPQPKPRPSVYGKLIPKMPKPH